MMSFRSSSVSKRRKCVSIYSVTAFGAVNKNLDVCSDLRGSNPLPVREGFRCSTVQAGGFEPPADSGKSDVLASPRCWGRGACVGCFEEPMDFLLFGGGESG